MPFETLFTETAGQPIVIRNSKWKLLLMGLICLGFVLIGISMVSSSSQSSKDYYGGLLGLIFFGLCLFVVLFQMFTPSLLLIIDDEGIRSFFPLWRPLTIRWEEILCIYPIKMRFHTTLIITVSSKGRPTYLARNYKRGKIPFTLRKAGSYAAVIGIPLATATLSYAKVIALIQERYAAQIRQYRIDIREK